MKTVKTVMYLECKLTEPELKEFSRKLAESISRKTHVENEIEAFKAQKKGEIQQLEGIIAQMTEHVNSEKVFRNVECEIQFEFGSGIKNYYRTDTRAMIRTEPISESERQEELDLQNKPESDNPEPAKKSKKK